MNRERPPATSAGLSTKGSNKEITSRQIRLASQPDTFRLNIINANCAEKEYTACNINQLNICPVMDDIQDISDC